MKININIKVNKSLYKSSRELLSSFIHILRHHNGEPEDFNDRSCPFRHGFMTLRASVLLQDLVVIPCPNMPSLPTFSKLLALYAMISSEALRKVDKCGFACGR